MAKQHRATIVIQATMELRFEKKLFSFIDRRGEIADSLLSSGKYEKIIISPERIDLADDDLINKLFLSSDNTGMQNEAIVSFGVFRSSIAEFFNNDIITELTADKPLIRVGTRAKIFYFKNGMGDFKKINNTYQSALLSDSDSLNEALNGKITDSNYIYDFDLLDKKGHISVAPMLKKQALEVAFDNSKKYIDALNNQHGAFFDIDIYNDKLNSLRVSDAGSLAEECWSEVEEIFKKVLFEIFGLQP